VVSCGTGWGVDAAGRAGARPTGGAGPRGGAGAWARPAGWVRVGAARGAACGAGADERGPEGLRSGADASVLCSEV
jgi:hypothetical protein